MPIFGFFGGNLLRLAARGSRLAARGSGSQARKIASPVFFPFLIGMLIYCRVAPQYFTNSPVTIKLGWRPGHPLLVLRVNRLSLDKNALTQEPGLVLGLPYPSQGYKPLHHHASPHIIIEKYSWLVDQQFWPKVSGHFRSQKIVL